MRRVLIVEDEPKILEFTQSYISNAGYDTLTAANGTDALKLFESSQVDMVILDLMLPDISGEEVCRKIRLTSDIPIIMLTAKTTEDSIIAGLKMGADDYVTKPFSPRQLAARVDALFRRTASTMAHPFNNPSEATVNQPIDEPSRSIVIHSDAYTASLFGTDLGLTKTEYMILKTLIARPTKVFTREELAELVFDGRYEGYARSLDSHIKNVRNKVSQVSDHNYISTVRGIGYRYCEMECTSDET